MLAWPALIMTRTPRLAWLFDVDGTLLLTEGAAREAFARTVREVLGIEDDLRDIAFAGRTEPLILGDILAAHGRALAIDDEARFWNVVFDHMRRLLGPNRGRLLPGVLPLLDAIAREPAWILGLLTGNMTEMAAIKLQRFGLAGRFAFGAYGEMAPDRNALACLAVERVTREFGLSPERCIVVGDTEHDIACARAAGAHVVAVATGSRQRAELEKLAPDLVLEDLSDAGALLEWAREIEREPTRRSSGSRSARRSP
jgi:phosphoglycolate phosphatase-like HAD superfamily hydrolase